MSKAAWKVTKKLVARAIKQASTTPTPEAYDEIARFMGFSSYQAMADRIRRTYTEGTADVKIPQFVRLLDLWVVTRPTDERS